MSSAQQTVATGLGPPLKTSHGVGPPLKTSHGVGPPLWLLLELTYRCPLHCVFCYNPTEFARTAAELATADWLRVLREARALGAVQLGLSGGEPLVREDLETIVAEAHTLGFYINLITSGVGMTEAAHRRAQARRARPHPAVLPGQHPRDERFPEQHAHFRAEVEGGRAHPQARLPDGAQRGAAPSEHRPRGRDPRHGGSACGRSTSSSPTRSTTAGRGSTAQQLLPSRAQLERAESVTQRFRERVRGRMQIYFVVPDYFETRPKPCMSGLGSVFLAIAPDGTAMPCHAARMLPGLDLPNVRDAGLREHLVRLRRPSIASAAMPG